MAVASNFPVQIQNQGIINVKNSERILRNVFTFQFPYLVFSTTGYNLITYSVAPFSGHYPILTVQTSNDGINWSTVQPTNLGSVPSNLSATGTPGAGGSSYIAGGVNSYQVVAPGKFVRMSQISSVEGGAVCVVNIVLSNGSPAVKQQDINIPTLFTFSYASASGGIVNTTPVGIATTAINKSLFYVLLSLDLVNAGLTDTEVIIRSNATVGGASPTVIYRTFIKAGTSQSLRFKPGIKGVAAQLMEVVLSATATVYVNAQGTQINY